MDEELKNAIRAREARDQRTRSRLEFLQYYGDKCLECERPFEWTAKRRPYTEFLCGHVKCRECVGSTHNEERCLQCPSQYYVMEELPNINTEPYAEEVVVETHETCDETSSPSLNGALRDLYEESKPEVIFVKEPIQFQKNHEEIPVKIEHTSPIYVSAFRPIRIEQGSPESEMVTIKEESCEKIAEHDQYVQQIFIAKGQEGETGHLGDDMSDEDILRYFSGPIPFHNIDKDFGGYDHVVVGVQTNSLTQEQLDVDNVAFANDNSSAPTAFPAPSRSDSPVDIVPEALHDTHALPNLNLQGGGQSEIEDEKPETSESSNPPGAHCRQESDHILCDSLDRKSKSSNLSEKSVVKLAKSMPREGEMEIHIQSMTDTEDPPELLDLTSKKQKHKGNNTANEQDFQGLTASDSKSSIHESQDNQRTCNSFAIAAVSVPILVPKILDSGGLVIQKTLPQKRKISSTSEIPKGKSESPAAAKDACRRTRNFLPQGIYSATSRSAKNKTDEVESSTLLISRTTIKTCPGDKSKTTQGILKVRDGEDQQNEQRMILAFNKCSSSDISPMNWKETERITDLNSKTEIVGLNLSLSKPGERKNYTKTKTTMKSQTTSGLNHAISAAIAAPILNSIASSVIKSTKQPIEPVVIHEQCAKTIEKIAKNTNVTVMTKDFVPNDTEIPSTSTASTTKREKKKRSPVPMYDYINVIKKVVPGPKEQEIYECTYCKKSFKTRGHVKYHAYCGNEKEKPFRCLEKNCGQTFIAKSHFEYHTRTHTNERPYVCTICQKGFNATGKLRRHMRTHTGERPYECPHFGCGKTFKNSQARNTHNLIHTGERPFLCTVCDKTFHCQTNLNKHKFVHTGERPHECGHCGKRFSLKWTLDTHKSSHSGYRPYACDECSRAFTNSKDLRRHKAIHSPEKPFKCHRCGQCFRRKDNRDRHLKQIHSIVKVKGTTFLSRSVSRMKKK